MRRPSKRFRWIAPGDCNAFFALMLDNMLNLVMLTAILAGFGYPTEYIFRLMIPGTALGVFVGDIVYTWMAVRLAAKTGRDDVTAMPLGLDAPSTIGVAVVVLGPVWLETKDPVLTWQVGMATLVCMGIVKVICSFIGDWVRRAVPEAGLIGSLGGVGLALLAFLPLMHVFSAPVIGLIALGLILYAFVAKCRLPLGIPGALAAVVIGTVLWHLLGPLGLLGEHYTGLRFSFPMGVPFPHLGFVKGFSRAIEYLPVAIPFGILTIIGGINVTESARLAGDDYKTRDILLTEAVATLVAGVCGGVSQSTPYIGHPAFKEMGARAGYTLATAIFIGLGGCLGYVPFIVDLIPAASVAPILIFIGIEILAQAYQECPKAHAAAVGLALLPSVAELVRIVVTGSLHVSAAMLAVLPEALRGEALRQFKLVELLGHGFILTAMLWGGAFALLIDRRLARAAVFVLLCAAFTSVGLIHSAAPEGGLYLPWNAPDPMASTFTAGYLGLAAMLVFLVRWAGPEVHRKR